MGSIIVGFWGPGEDKEDKEDNSSSSLCLAIGALVVGATAVGSVYWQKHTTTLPTVRNGTIEVKQ